MNESEPRNTFRGLPLTSEQDSEIRHYIHVRSRSGLPWDTPELQAMIADMLDPPEVGDEDSQTLGESTTAERSTADAEPDADLRDSSGAH
ncbi:hypothetical protein GQL84_23545 [Escherichia coli]|nr:hypothetical protein [Escherichia coli]